MEPNNEDVAAVVAAAVEGGGVGGADMSGHDGGGHDAAAVAAQETTNNLLLPADPEADANDTNNDEEEDNENEEPEADADGRDDEHEDINEIAEDEEVEEEEEAVDGEVEEEEEDRMAIQKLLSVLQQREDFPVRQRNKIIELAHEFVNNLGADIKEMVTDQRPVADGYAGLDSNRDTRKEVETALRHYPETLSEQGGRYNHFPIQCITILDRAKRKWVCNPMAVSFVVLFAKLAIELNSFADEERGGLLARSRGDGGCNTLANLAQSSHESCDEEYHQLVDTQFLEVLVQLQRSGLFKREDIQQYELVHRVCKQRGYFAEKRFHCLTNWDPSSLVQLDNFGRLPLYFGFATQTIRQFQVMLNCYFQYFTKEQVICCLFQQDNHGHTPFQRACKYLHKHKTDTLVHDVVEQSLGTARFSSPTATSSSSSSSSSLNIGTMLMMATRNNNISLDGWYYFIRKQPDTMLSMLRHRRRCDDTASVISSSLSSPSSLSNNNNNTGTNGRNTGISHSSNNNNNNNNTGINDDSASIDRTNNTNNTNNDDDTTLHNNDNNNDDDVVVRRRTARKRKQRS